MLTNKVIRTYVREAIKEVESDVPDFDDNSHVESDLGLDSLDRLDLHSKIEINTGAVLKDTDFPTPDYTIGEYIAAVTNKINSQIK